MPEPAVAVTNPQVTPVQTVAPVTPQAIPTTQQPSTAVTPQPAEVTASDLVKRVNQQTVSSPPVEAQLPEEFRLNREEFLRDVTDPAKRAMLEKKLMAIDRAANDKFMKIAELRKQTESQVNQPWTAERVNALLSDPTFVQSAQAVAQARAVQQPPQTWTGNQEEWSALNDKEKAAWNTMQVQVAENKRANDQLLAQQAAMQSQQEHDKLKTKYPDYDSNMVDQFMRDVIDNRVTGEQLKELVWKAQNFNRYVENSYRFGLQDRNGSMQEKLAGATPTSNLSVSTLEEIPKMEQGERSSNYFQRLARWRLTRKT